MMKRIISCLLVCFLLLGLCPAALAAAGSPTATAAVTANAQGSATVVLTVKAGSGSSHGRVTATMPAGLTLASARSLLGSEGIGPVEHENVYALQLSLPETKETVSVSVEIPGVFRDVSADDWFFNAVYDAYGRGLMVGESSDLFAPNDSMTRAMLITTLYRMSGSPAVTGENPYSDVPAGSYYEKAVIWAMQKGVANGMGGGKFEPDTRVTRQQAVTMLYRYAVKIAGIRTDERAELGRFTDSTKINAYAITAMRWAVGSGLMKGYPDNTLQPNGTLTRAEAATLLVWLAAKV